MKETTYAGTLTLVDKLDLAKGGAQFQAVDTIAWEGDVTGSEPPPEVHEPMIEWLTGPESEWMTTEVADPREGQSIFLIYDKHGRGVLFQYAKGWTKEQVEKFIQENRS